MNNGELIRIGNQTSFAAATLLEPFEYALANGFGAFEWFPDKKASGAGWDENDLSATLREEIRERARAARLRQSVHARWTANPLRAEASPALLEDLDLAETLGASLLNVHLYPEEGVKEYARAIAPLVQQAAASGLQVSIENTPETTPQHFNELFVALQHRLDSTENARVGLCLDLGHANLCAATRNDYLAYLDQLAHHVPIIHLHFHENWGDADSHLPLFTGPSATDDRGIREVLRRLHERDYTGSLILEQWPQPPALLNAARDRLRHMLDELEPPTSASSTDAKKSTPRQAAGLTTSSIPVF